MKNYPHYLSLLCRLFLLLSCTVWGVVHAEKADRDQPTHIEADKLHYDDLKQRSVFTGHVIMTKGTLVLRGERLEMQQDAQGYQTGSVTAQTGQRAFYRQKRDGADEFVEGEGETIEYDGRADRVRFVHKAELRRYREDTLSDRVTGDVITYDNVTDVFTVDGAPASGKAAGKKPEDTRVRVMLSPKTNAPAPASAPAPATGSTKPEAAGASGASGASPALRQTPALVEPQP